VGCNGVIGHANKRFVCEASWSNRQAGSQLADSEAMRLSLRECITALIGWVGARLS